MFEEGFKTISLRTCCQDEVWHFCIKIKFDLFSPCSRRTCFPFFKKLLEHLTVSIGVFLNASGIITNFL